MVAIPGFGHRARFNETCGWLPAKRFPYRLFRVAQSHATEVSLQQKSHSPTRKGNTGNTVVELDGNRCPVRRTPKRGLRQVDFVFDGSEIRALEQNPDTRSEWAKLARSRKLVLQFLSEGRYVAVVVDGKAKVYGGRP